MEERMTGTRSTLVINLKDTCDTPLSTVHDIITSRATDFSMQISLYKFRSVKIVLYMLQVQPVLYVLSRTAYYDLLSNVLQYSLILQLFSVQIYSIMIVHTHIQPVLYTLYHTVLTMSSTVMCYSTAWYCSYSAYYTGTVWELYMTLTSCTLRTIKQVHYCTHRVHWLIRERQESQWCGSTC